MKNNAILYGIIGLLIGIVMTRFAASNAVNSQNMGMMRMMGMNSARSQEIQKDSHMMYGGKMMDDNDMRGGRMGDDDSMSMNGMVTALEGKTGDDFDGVFLDLMIEHHQGAIDMAKEAKVSAKHIEIKNLSDEIITAQTKEIEMMQEWQKLWGY